MSWGEQDDVVCLTRQPEDGLNTWIAAVRIECFEESASGDSSWEVDAQTVNAILKQ